MHKKNHVLVHESFSTNILLDISKGCKVLIYFNTSDIKICYNPMTLPFAVGFCEVVIPSCHAQVRLWAVCIIVTSTKSCSWLVLTRWAVVNVYLIVVGELSIDYFWWILFFKSPSMNVSYLEDNPEGALFKEMLHHWYFCWHRHTMWKIPSNKKQFFVFNHQVFLDLS